MKKQHGRIRHVGRHRRASMLLAEVCVGYQTITDEANQMRLTLSAAAQGSTAAQLLCFRGTTVPAAVCSLDAPLNARFAAALCLTCSASSSASAAACCPPSASTCALYISSSLCSYASLEGTSSCTHTQEGRMAAIAAPESTALSKLGAALPLNDAGGDQQQDTSWLDQTGGIRLHHDRLSVWLKQTCFPRGSALIKQAWTPPPHC